MRHFLHRKLGPPAIRIPLLPVGMQDGSAAAALIALLTKETGQDSRRRLGFI